jgi:hypothetical protein
MFSVGIISSKAVVKLVNLYDFAIPAPRNNDANFVLATDGRASYYNAGSNFFIPDMWYVGPGINPSIGFDYECRITKEAGEAGNAQGVWGDLWNYGLVSFGASVEGRVKVEIRKKGAPQVLATCRVWRGASYAP